MNFQALPDNVFNRIFAYLPLCDQLRAGRVSRAFRRASQIAVSQTKIVDPPAEMFDKLKPNHLRILLDLCAPVLEELKFHGFHTELVITFSEYSCPRLRKLDIGCTTVEGSDILDRVIRNNPNLKTLIWNAGGRVQPEVYIQYPAITTENLVTLKTCVNDAALQSLTGRVPNLRHLKVLTDEVDAAVLDAFFASVPHLKTLHIGFTNNTIQFQHLTHFWHLRSLESLHMNFSADDFDLYEEHMVGDDALCKIGSAFPKLHDLRLGVWGPTDAGFTDLKKLMHLQKASFTFSYGGQLQNGIRELAGCESLKEIEVRDSNITVETLIAVILGCPELSNVTVGSVIGPIDPTEAADALQPLFGMRSRTVTIAFRPSNRMQYFGLKSIWDSEPVSQVLRHLEEIDGVVIKLDYVEPPGPVFGFAPSGFGAPEPNDGEYSD